MPITHSQYLTAKQLILDYRKQKVEESRRISAEVKALNLTGKKIDVGFNYYGITKTTLMQDIPMSGRLWGVLMRPNPFGAGLDEQKNALQLKNLSQRALWGYRNFGEKCMNELLTLCKHLKIELLP